MEYPSPAVVFRRALEVLGSEDRARGWLNEPRPIRFLKPFEKTIIDLNPTKTGSFEFACGMSMLRGRIEVEG